MTKLTQILFVGVMLAASAPLALAIPITGSIGIAGSDTFTSTSMTFLGPGTVISTSGTFNSFTGFGSTLTLNSFSFNSSADGTTLFSLTNILGQTLSFDITGITASGTIPTLGYPNEEVAGTGTLNDVYFHSPYTPTAASFVLSTNTNGSTTFALDASTEAVVPEPSSLLLFGSGLVSAVGALIRKRRILA